MNTLEVLQIRRPRGSSIDVHVSLTRSMPRITVDDFLFFFFFSLPVLLWEPCSSVRGKNNDEKIVGIKYLKSWGVLRTVVRKNETVLHDVERIGMVEVFLTKEIFDIYRIIISSGIILMQCMA